MSTRCDRAPSWAQLKAHHDGEGRGFDLRRAFAADAIKLEKLMQESGR